ncbi:hypothetical protein HUS84_21230 [Pseudomonas chlororaphis]|uniref:hypothetical protein n=1 Tax=Pseudomonas chlororaphis TaxID=587753 RepID=UPI001B33F811|nr:hypothetical protein [Pseudomonas chlororaphis]MBP5076459.1 hypothetical protein [Pseudomonas chlororaphis]
MKTLLIATALALLAVFYVGYYQALEDGDIETIVFIMKRPWFSCALWVRIDVREMALHLTTRLHST